MNRVGKWPDENLREVKPHQPYWFLNSSKQLHASLRSR